MPAVRVVFTISGYPNAPVMTIQPEGDQPVSLVSSPVTVTGDSAVHTINETERPGRAPITKVAAPGLRRASFEHQVNSLNPYASIEAQLSPIRAAAEKGKRVQFFNGGMLLSGKWWLIESMKIAEDMKAADNRTSRATVSWTVKEANYVSAVELTKNGVKPGGVAQPGRTTPDPHKPHIPGWNG